MSIWSYRGLVTKKVYRFNTMIAPPETLVVVAGENCVLVNNDGSIRRGVAGPIPSGQSPYSTYDSASMWEQS